MSNGDKILCDDCRELNNGICKVTGLVAPALGTCAYYDSRSDISKPKFAAIMTGLERNTKLTLELKDILINGGDYLEEGIIPATNKNTKFRERSEMILKVLVWFIGITGGSVTFYLLMN